MSHNKERAEKLCLNCGADLIGRYCHVCGQENLEPKESLWHLISHYAYDITHFDGKFFSTLKYLVVRPGFLPAEYLRGRRASYLHPIRMYVFTSAFFFIIAFSLLHLGDSMVSSSPDGTDSLRHKKSEIRQKAYGKVRTKEDSEAVRRALNGLEAGHIIPVDSAAKGSLAEVKDAPSTGGIIRYSIEESIYKTVKEYDSAQAALPESKRDGWITRGIERKDIELRARYHNDGDAIREAWKEKFTHMIPQLLFVSLPLFSFVLWLLYIRRKKQYFYTGHIVFSLYLYIFYFIAYLLYFGFKALHDGTGWFIWTWLEIALWIYMFYYLYKALRNFYGQGRGKTILKLLLLSFSSWVILIFLFIVFTLFSAYSV